ncbi:hypothetical protein D3C79_959930 [compost metagenome]
MCGYICHSAHCRKSAFDIGLSLVAAGLQVHLIGMRIISRLLQPFRMAAYFLKRPMQPVRGNDNFIAETFDLVTGLLKKLFPLQSAAASIPCEPAECCHQQQEHQLMDPKHIYP